MLLSHRCGGVALAAAVTLMAAGAQAGSHLWRINEIFTTADGNIQFVELTEIGGSDDEWHLQGKHLRSNLNTYVFPSNLPPTTANRQFLIGTQSFASLVGVPVPDYVIPDNFFDTSTDSVILHVYDLFVYEAGELPVNGLDSLHRMAGTIGPNSPTNITGTTANVDLSIQSDTDGITDLRDNCSVVDNPAQRDTDADGIGNRCDPDIAPVPNDCTVNFGDLAAMKAAFLSNPVTGNWNPDADLDGNELVNFGDVAIMKSLFLDPPGPSGVANPCN